MMALPPNQSADARPAALNWDLAALLEEVSADDAGGDEEVALRRRGKHRPPGPGTWPRGQRPRRWPGAKHRGGDQPFWFAGKLFFCVRLADW